MAMTLQVGGMTCEHCVRAVTKALEGVAGVQTVSVNLSGGRASVEGEADPQALVRALQQEGYQAKVLATP